MRRSARRDLSIVVEELAFRAVAAVGNANDSSAIIRGMRDAAPPRMRARLALVSLLSLAACHDDGAILGPFTGETHRFAVDDFVLPAGNNDAREAAKDIGGDTTPDNQLGMVLGTLGQYGDDRQSHVPDLLASGAFAPTIEIEADDLANDPAAGVTFYGYDGAPARVVGGQIVEGVFHPNPITETDGEHTGNGRFMLPAFADVDPMELDVVSLEIHLVPDGDGYMVKLAGAMRPNDVLEKTREAIHAQIENHPETHRSMWTLVDKNLDGTLTAAEMNSSLLVSLLAPDLTLSIDGDPEDVLSFGFELHAKPCAVGHCLDAAVANTCFDRVQDGDETDVDCGGSCAIACAGGRACTAGEDCQSRACDAGTCAAVSCTDGVKNGLEASLDCGGACGTKCSVGQVCGYAFDCLSGNCSATVSTGTCR